jgi:hypothetical protein
VPEASHDDTKQTVFHSRFTCQLQIAEDAYIYGYSLITTEVTRVQMTNVPPAENVKAPMNSFGNVKRYPPGDYRGVSAPNADTLYSIDWHWETGSCPLVQ